MAKKKNTKKTNGKKAPAKLASIVDTINSEVIAATKSFANLPVLLKVCRLCEAKDGPFLNIFDADKVTAKKIEIVMPFGIAENDDLPHKICFRCSAKVEELYEFIQKCIRTQHNLRKVVGSKISAKTKQARERWEEKLNQSNISNDDICDALIKKAMEGIKDIPLDPLPVLEDKPPLVKKANKKTVSKKEDEKPNEVEEKVKEDDTKDKDNEMFTPNDEKPISSLKKIRQNDLDEDEPPTKRITRLSNEKKVEVVENKPVKSVDNKETSKPSIKGKTEAKTEEEPKAKDKGLKIKKSLQTNNFSLETTSNADPPKSEPEPKKPFDIMENVSMIKVNSVGVLFQCKLCNRNFLKREVVLTHACAKLGAPKVQAPKSYVPPEPPKVPQTVKYITTIVNKEVSKPPVSEDKPKILEYKEPVCLGEPITLDDDEDDKLLTVKKPPKPRIGPASKVRRSDTPVTPVANNSTVTNTNQRVLVTTPSNPMAIVPNITATITSATQPSVQFPTIPSLNSRYKLMPGPNNTFTLVEDKAADSITKPVEPQNNTIPYTVNESNKTDDRSNNTKVRPIENSVPMCNISKKQVEPTVKRPYPVGLIKSIPAAGSRPPVTSDTPIAFPTPAMKKQSYTVVPTGNPSKLLISTKPQPPPQIEEHVPKKRSRKSRHLVKPEEPQRQSFSVSMEESTPPPDTGFFTLINVDPLLQPSYVLPTNNIIQESQISTSTNVSKQPEDKDNKYTCNMCNEKFSREKKLLAHIQSHYEKMDQEDQKRTEKCKKRSKK